MRKKHFQKILEEKFQPLNREELVEHLSTLAQRSEENWQYIQMIGSKDLYAKLQSKIESIDKSSYYYKYNELNDFSRKLTNLINEIRDFAPSGDEAITLLLSFFELDRRTIEGSDDDGVMSMIFTDEALPLLRSFWKDCENKLPHQERIKEMLLKNYYGIRDALEEFLVE